jgi:hypothetical protein
MSWEEIRDEVFDHWTAEEHEKPVEFLVEDVLFDDFGLRVKAELEEDGEVRLIVGDAPYGISGISLRRNSKGNAVITLTPQLPSRPGA